MLEGLDSKFRTLEDESLSSDKKAAEQRRPMTLPQLQPEVEVDPGPGRAGVPQLAEVDRRRKVPQSLLSYRRVSLKD